MNPCAIDIHHHYVPESLLEEARRHGRTMGVELKEVDGEKSLSFAGGPPFVLHPELPAVEKRLEMMQNSRLAMAALEAHTATLGYRLSGEQGETWCRVYNEGIKDLVARHPDRFVGMASVPLQDPARAARVLEDAIRDLKLRGGYIGTNVNGTYYGSTDFDPFWAKAQELDALIVMHPEDVAGSERMGPYGLKLICGNPADSALSLCFMTYSGVFDRFPGLKLCVLHGGGFFPYHLGRFDQGWQVRSGPRAPAARKPPSGYLGNIYYDNMLYRVDTIDYLRRLAGADHIMVGTDYPYSLGDWKAVEKVEALDCPDAEKQLMLEGNARRLLKL
ncbi:MAG TPA: amidohydrolase family protein [candidate division Zixibacteria bacterium]|nr:amidohydrolase family protein [candidate division Zixibacteria bacterium]